MNYDLSVLFFLFANFEIDNLHGGEMWAENNENGKGATIRFSLPIN